MKPRRERTLSDLPDEYLDCRRRHEWKWAGDDDIVWDGRQIVAFTLKERCNRCGTVKKAVLDARTGEVIRSIGSLYGEDYLIQHRVTMAEVRLEAFKRRRVKNGGIKPKRIQKSTSR